MLKNLTKCMSCQFFNKFLGTPSDPQRKTKHVLQGIAIVRISVVLKSFIKTY